MSGFDTLGPRLGGLGIADESVDWKIVTNKFVIKILFERLTEKLDGVMPKLAVAQDDINNGNWCWKGKFVC